MDYRNNNASNRSGYQFHVTANTRRINEIVRQSKQTNKIQHCEEVNGFLYNIND